MKKIILLTIITLSISPLASASQILSKKACIKTHLKNMRGLSSVVISKKEVVKFEEKVSLQAGLGRSISTEGN